MNQSINPKTIATRLAQLSAEKKAEFRALLASKNIDSWALPIVPIARTASLEVLSNAQQRLWFIDHYEQGSSLYNLYVFLDLNGQINQKALQLALGAVIDKHQILRSRYLQLDNTPWQQVIAAPEQPLIIETEVADIEARSQALSQQTFKLEQEPPLKLYLLQSTERQRLVFVVHHIAFDAWSEAVFIRDFSQAYAHYSQDSVQRLPSPLDEADIQYADFAAWQREWLASPQAHKQLKYWQTQLTNAPDCLPLPLDRARPGLLARTYTGSEVKHPLAPDLLDKLKHFALSQNVTLYAVMQAAFVLLLNKTGAGRDICLGTTVANRQRPELENMIGFLVNTLVMRHQLKAGFSFRQLVRQVATTNRDAFDNQDLPFDLLLDKLNIPRGQDWSALFQVLFVYQNVPRQTLTMGNMAITRVSSDINRARFDLTLRLNEYADGLSADMEYSCELFDRSTIVCLLEQYQTLLFECMAEPDRLLTSQSAHQPMQQQVTRTADVVSEDQAELCQIILRTCQQVLNKPDFGAADSFFAYGGDSILSLQLVAALKKQAIKVTPKQVFALQTPNALTLALQQSTASVAISTPTQNFLVPLAPIQQWFFEQQFAQPHHWNQSVLLRCDTAPDSGNLLKAVAHVFAAHPMLNARFQWQESTASWQQTLVPATPVVAEHQIAYATLDTLMASCQTSLHLQQTALIRVDLIRFTDRQDVRILLTAHHLVIDAVSWRILVTQFWQSYQQLAAGLALPELTSSDSYVRWVNSLQHKPALMLQHARHYWQPLAEQPEAIQSDWIYLPRVNAEQENLLADSSTLEFTLEEELSQLLITKALSAYRLKTEEVLVAALSQALATWRNTNVLLLELESHGRQHDELDLSQTLGWFTSRYPVMVHAQHQYSRLNIKQLLVDTAAQLRKVPAYGQDFGVLKYLHNELRELTTPSVVLNYLGQTDKGLSTQGISLASEPVPQQRHGSNRRTHWLDINAMITRGQLVLRWTYNHKAHNAEEITSVAHQMLEYLTRFIEHCVNAAPENTVADYPLLSMTQNRLTRLAASIPVALSQIDDIYPLTPLQNGMLFHTLSSDNPAMYVNQSVTELNGTTDPVALRLAWLQVIQQHDILRTGFVWQDLDEPLQFVMQHLEPQWQEYDWQHLSVGQATEKMTQLAQTEMQSGFALNQPGLQKFCLIKLSELRSCLIWTRHHLIVDGWSTNLILADVKRAYQSKKYEPDGHLIPARPFKDFIVWLQIQSDQAQQQYWQKLLQGYTSRAMLPKPFVGKDGFTQQSSSLPAAITDQLKALAATHKLTLNSLCQTAWSLVLQRYTGQNDVLYGVTSAGRPDALADSSTMVGVFITTIPLRANIKQAATWPELAQQLQNQMGESREFEHTSITRIQQYTHQEHGLFDNILVFENLPGQSATSDPTLSLSLKATTERNHYPLTLVIVPGQQMSFRIVGNNRLVAAEITKGMLNDLIELLNLLLNDNQLHCAQLLKTLSDKTSLPQAQRWNNTQVLYRDQTLPVLLSCAAQQYADRTALSYRSESGEQKNLNYEELDSQANKLAHYLLHHYQVNKADATTQKPIALCMTRSVQMVVAIVAIVKSGCAYLPLDPDLPAQRKAYMLDNADAQLILTTPDCQSLLAPDSSVPQLCLDESFSVTQSQSAAAPEISLLPEHLAYVIYTSGSTGQPKGVAVAHAGVVNRLHWMQQEYKLSPSDVVLQKTPYSFDVSVWEFFWPLISGATLVVAEPEAHKNAAHLIDLIRQHQITTLHFVPSMLQTFLDQPGVQLCSSLQRVICSGEALPYTLQQHFISTLAAGLHNLYGPTEASIDVTSWNCRAQQLPGVVPIGKPIANMQTWILDKQLNPVPAGVTGELYLSGIGLAQGYLGQPELTEAAFIANPMAEQNATTDREYKRLYKTGDLARYHPDGVIEYLGRADFQVKIRGLRIELGEIEHAMAQHPDVKEVVVVACKQPNQDDCLAAYIVAKIPAANDVADLNSWQQRLSHQLPDYMCPTIVTLLEQMPLTANGKLDRKALPHPQWQSHQLQLPSTTTEIQLAEIWKQLLNLEQVGRHDNFFRLGGHSLLITRLVNRVNQSFSLQLQLKDVMDINTLAQQAGYIDMQLSALTVPRQDSEERESFEL